MPIFEFTFLNRGKHSIFNAVENVSFELIRGFVNSTVLEPTKILKIVKTNMISLVKAKQQNEKVY